MREARSQSEVNQSGPPRCQRSDHHRLAGAQADRDRPDGRWSTWPEWEAESVGDGADPPNVSEMTRRGEKRGTLRDDAAFRRSERRPRWGLTVPAYIWAESGRVQTVSQRAQRDLKIPSLAMDIAFHAFGGGPPVWWQVLKKAGSREYEQGVTVPCPDLIRISGLDTMRDECNGDRDCRPGPRRLWDRSCQLYRSPRASYRAHCRAPL